MPNVDQDIPQVTQTNLTPAVIYEDCPIVTDNSTAQLKRRELGTYKALERLQYLLTLRGERFK